MLPEDFDEIGRYVLSKHPTSRHATLLDPDNQSPEKAAEIAQIAIESGTDMLMIGGSTGTHPEQVDQTVVSIQETLELRCWAASQDMNGTEDMWKTPLLLFPNGSRALSESADGLLFMMMLNSRNPRFLIGEQFSASSFIRSSGMQTISAGYLVFEPGMRVAEVGEAEMVDPLDLPTVGCWALTTERFGFELLYLEAGSGARPPLGDETIITARSSFSRCLMVGGGIRRPDQARAAASAGADWVVTGNLVESLADNEELGQRLKELIAAIHDA